MDSFCFSKHVINKGTITQIDRVPCVWQDGLKAYLFLGNSMTGESLFLVLFCFLLLSVYMPEMFPVITVHCMGFCCFSSVLLIDISHWISAQLQSYNVLGLSRFCVFMCVSLHWGSLPGIGNLCCLDTMNIISFFPSFLSLNSFSPPPFFFSKNRTI